jgi:predicted DNA-binding transcriptional regulator AlpA
MFDHERHQVDPLLDEQQAAEVVGTTRKSLKDSRHKGELFGEEAPRYLKMGRSVRYRLSELIRFREQFSEYANTAEANHSAVNDATEPNLTRQRKPS